MSKSKKNLQALIENYLKDISSNQKIIIDDNIISDLLSDNKLSEGLEMINEKINNASKKLLPTLQLQYKISNMLVGKINNIKPELLNFSLESLEKCAIDSIVGFEEIGGITWNSEAQHFEGTAENAGTYKLVLKGTFKSSKGYTQSTESSCNLTVIPDPKSLWKNLEPDETIPYGKNHEDSSYLETSDGSRLLYASKRGRSHAHVGTYRDDDGKILAIDTGWSVLVIADGGGSYPLSRRGSELVVDKSIQALEKVLSSEMGIELETAFFKYKENNTDELKDALDSKLKATMLSSAFTGLDAIKKEAAENSKDIKDYSTTLLMAAHKKTPNGHLILTFWVGDGVIVVYSQGKKVELLGVPDSGEFAGQTRFLDESFFYDTKRIEIQLVSDFTALILATDGVSDPYFETDEALGDFKKWDNFWNLISREVTDKKIENASSKLLEWLDFWSKGNHDDRTIALLLPTNKEGIDENIDDKSNEEYQDQTENESIEETSEESAVEIKDDADISEVDYEKETSTKIENEEFENQPIDTNPEEIETLVAVVDEVIETTEHEVEKLEPETEEENENPESKDNDNNG